MSTHDNTASDVILPNAFRGATTSDGRCAVRTLARSVMHCSKLCLSYSFPFGSQFIWRKFQTTILYGVIPTCYALTRAEIFDARLYMTTMYPTLSSLRHSEMNKSPYDTDVTVWSPQGRLFQVEYAMEAVKQGSCVGGLRSKQFAVIAAMRARHAVAMCGLEARGAAGPCLR